MINRRYSSYAVDASIEYSISVINTMFVGVVLNVDVSARRYSVKPVLNNSSEDGSVVEQAIIVDCPFSFQVNSSYVEGSSFSIGDYVYVGVSKDSIDISLNDNANKNIDDNKMPCFRVVDGVILNGIMKEGQSFDFLKEGEYIIHSRKNGSYLVFRSSGDIEVFTSTNVNVKANAVKVEASVVDVIATTVTIDAPNTTITGNTNIGGVLTVTGASMLSSVSASQGMQASGNIQSNGDITAGGISVKNHSHPGVQPGSGNTGVAQ